MFRTYQRTRLGARIHHTIQLRNSLSVVARWLTNEQALEDSANFMRNVKFEGIAEDLTAPNTPWIYYGVRVPFFGPF